MLPKTAIFCIKLFILGLENNHDNFYKEIFSKFLSVGNQSKFLSVGNQSKFLSVGNQRESYDTLITIKIQRNI